MFLYLLIVYKMNKKKNISFGNMKKAYVFKPPNIVIVVIHRGSNE
jgi:hypothetical protein